MDIKMLQSTGFFQGMTESEACSAMKHLDASEQTFRKGAVILSAGTVTQRLGMVLSGSVTIENNDLWGNRTILSHAESGQFFAETYALLENEPLLVDVAAKEDCQILFFRIGSLRHLRSLSEPWAMKLIANLLSISSRKNLLLSERNFHTAPKTIRGRIMSYLNSVSLQKHSRQFDIPFDRQQLADYLNVDRSALSKELGKMQKDGILSVRKNHFTVHGGAEKTAGDAPFS